MSDDKKKTAAVKAKQSKAVPGGRAKAIFRAAGKPFRETFAELKKVTWPTQKQLVTYTIVVSVFVLIVAAVVGLIDLGLLQIYGLAF